MSVLPGYHPAVQSIAAGYTGYTVPFKNENAGVLHDYTRAKEDF